MIDDIENKIENLRLQECSLKNRSSWKVSHFAKNVYKMETVTSGLCYIEDLIFLENNIVWSEILWISSQLIVQWNYIIYFPISGFFFNRFLHQFLERVHYSKETVNLQGLFILTVSYIDIKTY